MLAVSIACVFMAAIVFYCLQAGGPPTTTTTVSNQQIASVAPLPLPASLEPQRTARTEQQASRSANHDDAETFNAQNAIAPPALAQAASASPTQAASASPRETLAMLAPPAPSPDAAGSSKAARTLDPEEISLLIKEGEKHIAVGDVVTARVIFQRAAEAGDATAALALAATYDPTVLAKLGVMGMGADVEKARTWYRMAESYGSAEAKQRLQLLDRH
jgi:hypothetical protein